MLKCRKCGADLEAVMVEGVIHCACGTDNKIIKGKVVETESNQASGTWDAPTPSDKKTQDNDDQRRVDESEDESEDEDFEGKDAVEETVDTFMKNYRQYFEIDDLPATLEAFCSFTGLAADSVITRGRFKHLWNQFKGQSE